MKVLKQLRFSLPLIIFLFIFVLLWRGLNLHPSQVPSPFIDKYAPTIQLPSLFDSKRIITNQDFLGQVTLLNVWATWCAACAEEHESLLQLADSEHITIYGLNYKDDPAAAKKWLDQFGNPYKLIAVDRDGLASIDWGVYGTPETFVIDKKGVIRYKLIGPIDAYNWENTLKPLVQKLQDEQA